MKKTWIVITMATLYAVFFQVSPYINFSENIITALFILSPFVVVYMTYVILKDGKPSDHSFEDRFYDDYDYKRNT